MEQSQKEARAKNQAKFDHFCRVIEAMVFVKDEAFKPLADEINQEVKILWHKLSLKKQTKLIIDY